MKRKEFLVFIFIAAMTACGNDGSREGSKDSTGSSDSVVQPGMFGSDSVPSPETQADTSNSVPNR
ncbi:MAG TPA: hypothetical protein VF145_12210 [Chitinophagaceae bacterium]